VPRAKAIWNANGGFVTDALVFLFVFNAVSPLTISGFHIVSDTLVSDNEFQTVGAEQ